MRVKILLSVGMLPTYMESEISGSHVASLKMTVFWDVALYSLVEVDQRFRSAYCLHHQGDRLLKRRSTYMILLYIYIYRYIDIYMRRLSSMELRETDRTMEKIT
jgi:hypothetical protein